MVDSRVTGSARVRRWSAFEFPRTAADLPATDPSAAWAAAELERVGFAWCAWMPAFLPTGDAIGLQRVSDHPVHLENIVCSRPEGDEVRDFVITEWTRVHRGRTVQGTRESGRGITDKGGLSSTPG